MTAMMPHLTTDFQIWATPGDPYHTLLVVGGDCLYISNDKPREHEASHQALLAGADPEEALSKDRVRIDQRQLREIRHQRDSHVIEFRYDNLQQKPCRVACALGDRTRAADVTGIVAAAMNLPDVPRQQEASVTDISIGPAVGAGIPLLMLTFLLVAAINADPDGPQQPRAGKARALRDIALFLGPTGVLAVMALVAFAAGGYWLYHFYRRPILDVYSATEPH